MEVTLHIYELHTFSPISYNNKKHINKDKTVAKTCNEAYDYR